MAKYAVASTTPAQTVHSGAGTNYIPTLYAGKLLVKFYEASVLGEVSNTDYEGMIRDQGDTVIIRTLPNITVSNHEKGGVLAVESPTSAPVILEINKGKYWNFRTDDPDEVQVNIAGWINEWTTEASVSLRNAIEIDVLANMAADAGAAGADQGAQSASFDLGTLAAPVSLTTSNIVDQIVDCGTVLDEANVPDDGRFFLLSPAEIGLIKKSELGDASKSGDGTSIVRNGLVGMIDRFRIFRTGNLLKVAAADNAAMTTGNIWYNLFGTKVATTFASQLVKSKTIDNPTGFGMLHRGLHVYGFKVVKPEALGVLLGGIYT